MKRSIIAFIPARKGSKSIKNKNLRKINNKTLIEITIDQAKKTKIFKDIILSTDSHSMINIGKKKNIKIVKRPKIFSTDKSRTEEALLHTLKTLYQDIVEDLSIIILQPTSPLRKHTTIKNFAKICIKKKYENALSVTKIDHNIAPFKKNLLFKPMQNKNIRRRQNLKKFLLENGSLYFCKKNKFLKDKKIFSNKWNFIITDIYESIDINDMIDLKVSKLLYKKI